MHEHASVLSCSGSSDPDFNIPWADVEALVLRSPQLPHCPICLDSPSLPVSGMCGHLFWYKCRFSTLCVQLTTVFDSSSCLLSHMGKEASRNCPVCSDIISRSDLRRVVMWLDNPFFKSLTHIMTQDLELRLDTAIDGSWLTNSLGLRHQLCLVSELHTHSFQNSWPELDPCCLAGIPVYGSRESVFARLSTVSRQRAIEDLNHYIDTLFFCRELAIKGMKADTCSGKYNLSFTSDQHFSAKSYCSVMMNSSLDLSEIEHSNVNASLFSPVSPDFNFIMELVHEYNSRVDWHKSSLFSDKISTVPLYPQHLSNKVIESPAIPLRIQSVSGVDIYLHPDDASALCCYSNLNKSRTPKNLDFPSNIKFSSNILDIESVVVTQKFRHNHPSIAADIPLNTVIYLIRFDMLNILLAKILATLSPQFSVLEKIDILRNNEQINKKELKKYQNRLNFRLKLNRQESRCREKETQEAEDYR